MHLILKQLSMVDFLIVIQPLDNAGLKNTNAEASAPYLTYKHFGSDI